MGKCGVKVFLAVKFCHCCCRWANQAMTSAFYRWNEFIYEIQRQRVALSRTRARWESGPLGAAFFRWLDYTGESHKIRLAVRRTVTPLCIDMYVYVCIDKHTDILWLLVIRSRLCSRHRTAWCSAAQTSTCIPAEVCAVWLNHRCI